MIRRGGSDWTAVAIDEVLAIFFTKRGRAAQLFENAQCSVNSLPAGFALQVRQMFPGYGSPSGAHSGAPILWLNPTREYRHQQRDPSPVGLRKQLFGLRPESVGSVWFANARFHAS